MLYTNDTQFIHFASIYISEKGEGGERDMEEWRARSGRGERGEQKYMYLYNFICFIQLETIFIHLYLYKKVRKRARDWRRVASEIFGREAPDNFLQTFAMEHN